MCQKEKCFFFFRSGTYNLLHDLARGVEVDQTLVNLEFEAIPGLGTFTTRLFEGRCNSPYHERLKEKRTVLRVVIFNTLVGRRTGPLTRSCLSFALLMRSAETKGNESL